MDKYVFHQHVHTAGQSGRSISRQAPPTQYRQSTQYGYPQRTDSLPQWNAQSQPTSRRQQAGQPRQQEDVGQARHREARVRQPVTSSADTEQWERLRRQGYVLRGHPSSPASSSQYYTAPMAQQPSPTAYAPSMASSWNHGSQRAQHRQTSRPPPLPSFDVQPHLRTASHPQARPRYPQPANAFMLKPDRPSPSMPGIAHPPKRPPIKYRPSASTVRTLHGAVQLRSDQVFLYERPSKASYYQPDPVYIPQEQAHSVQARRSLYRSPDLPEQQWSPPASYTPSIRSSPSRPQTPCQLINAQPAYPPSPSAQDTEHAQVPEEWTTFPTHITMHNSLRQRRISVATSHAGSTLSRKSRTLRRAETQQSCYSQQTYAEVYSNAMEQRVSQSPTLTSPSQEEAPPATALTEVSLGTCQRLWHELERELLVNDGEVSTKSESASRPLATRIEETFEGSEYDFTEDLAPTRPLLRRGKSSVHNYKGYERAGELVVDKARRAAEEHSPAPTPIIELLASKPDRPKHDSSISMKQVATLRSALKKTPAYELLESQAMQELKRQSAPSEVDASEYGCETPSDEAEEVDLGHKGQESKDEYGGSGTGSDTLSPWSLSDGSEIEQKGDSAPEVLKAHETATKEEEEKVVVRAVRIAAPVKLAQLVKRQTRIPAPRSREYADKHYASRAKIVKVQ